jgi:hypothetical protein
LFFVALPAFADSLAGQPLVAVASLMPKPTNTAPTPVAARPQPPGQELATEDQRGETKRAEHLQDRPEHQERQSRMGLPRLDELAEERDHEEDRLRVEQTDDQRKPERPLHPRTQSGRPTLVRAPPGRDPLALP